MAYDIHIKRLTGKLALSEWKSAVEQTKGVRLVQDDRTITNPVNGEAIDVSKADGDAEIFISAKDKWLAAFHWRPRSGDVTIKATPEFGDRSSPLRIAARQLASLLEAQLIGDEGEVYE